jgi:hypothetical protein
VQTLQGEQRYANYRLFSKFHTKFSELKLCPIMGFNMFHTLHKVTANNGDVQARKWTSIPSICAQRKELSIRTHKQNVTVE